MHQDSGSIIEGHPTQNAAAPEAGIVSLLATLDLPNEIDNIGLPTDGIWDHDAVYQERFCFDHGEVEWLLRTPDRWMRPSDFERSRVELRLEAKLQKTPQEFQPRHRLFQAECNGTLWSHVDVPLKKTSFKGDSVYLIRWKACWTPESNIPHLERVHALYQARIIGLDCRRSMRISSTATKRCAKNRAMMQVVDLERVL